MSNMVRSRSSSNKEHGVFKHDDFKSNKNIPNETPGFQFPLFENETSVTQNEYKIASSPTRSRPNFAQSQKEGYSSPSTSRHSTINGGPVKSNIKPSPTPVRKVTTHNNEIEAKESPLLNRVTFPSDKPHESDSTSFVKQESLEKDQSHPIKRVMSASPQRRISQLHDIDEKAISSPQQIRRNRQASLDLVNSPKTCYSINQARNNIDSHKSLVEQISSTTAANARNQCRLKYSNILLYSLKIVYHEYGPIPFNQCWNGRKNEIYDADGNNVVFYEKCSVDNTWKQMIHSDLRLLLDDVGIDIAEFMRIADFVSECPSDSLKTDGPPHIHIDIALRTIGEWQNTVISDFTEGNLKDLGNDIYRTILRLLVFYKSNKD